MLVVAIAAAWIALGAVAVIVMRLRGHDPFGWAILFLVLGPLALPLAVSAERHPPPEVDASLHEGDFDVLVAHDGSQTASVALDSALGLLGRHMTSLTLAAVVDVETVTTAGGRITMRDTHERLQTVADQVGTLLNASVETVVLHGDPVQALSQFAEQHGYELIVVGGSGPGPRRVRRGSVARRLAKGTPVPVLVGPTAR
ncbi:MAG TPA: universal stress protein [Acidimicrobiales bacterium]|nr:universal stress protein [Acidimicrobiales bacterium]